MTTDSNPLNFAKFMVSIANRTATFLKNEIQMDVRGVQKEFKKVPDVKLRDFTVLISLIIPTNSMSVAFSFDQSLINKICEIYCDELEIDPQELDEYVKETADDMINIIVGNSIPAADCKTGAIHITPPMIISNARNISAKKTISFFVNELTTDFGKMKIVCAVSNVN